MESLTKFLIILKDIWGSFFYLKIVFDKSNTSFTRSCMINIYLNFYILKKWLFFYGATAGPEGFR